MIAFYRVGYRTVREGRVKHGHRYVRAGGRGEALRMIDELGVARATSVVEVSEHEYVQHTHPQF